ncbi:MAG: hypothetical protein AAGA54_26075 [Myxococcota bacterium]
MLLALSGCIPPPDPGASLPAGSDVWAWQRVVEGPEGRTVVVYATAPLGSFDELDDTRAREVSGNGRLYVLDGQAFVGDFESMAVVRTTLQDGVLVDDSPRLSFALSGLTFLPNWTAPLEDGRALFVDSFSGVGVVWNRRTMELEDTRDFSRVVDPNFEAVMESAVRRGDDIFAPIAQTDPFSFTFFEGVQVARIDAKSGALLEILEDERCVGTAAAFWADDDDTLYLGADNHGYAAAFTETGAPSTCVLRIRAGATAFDPEYRLVLPALLDGAEARAFTVWRDGFAYVSARDDALVTTDFWDDPLDYGNQTAGRWWEVDLVGSSARQLDMPPHTLLSATAAVVDGRLLLQNPAAGLQGVTEIWELEAPGAEPVPRLSYAGLTPIIAPLRLDEPEP